MPWVNSHRCISGASRTLFFSACSSSTGHGFPLCGCGSEWFSNVHCGSAHASRRELVGWPKPVTIRALQPGHSYRSPKRGMVKGPRTNTSFLTHFISVWQLAHSGLMAHLLFCVPAHADSLTALAVNMKSSARGYQCSIQPVPLHKWQPLLPAS